MLSEQEKWRYQRQLRLAGFGPQGQQRLKNSRILLIGLGGLGRRLPSIYPQWGREPLGYAIPTGLN